MRVTTSKSKNAESFYINHAFIDKNGKSTSKVFKKLGTLKELSEKLGTDRDGVMAWAKEQARIATELYNKEHSSVSISFSPDQLIDFNSQRLIVAISIFSPFSLLFILIISVVTLKIVISLILILTLSSLISSMPVSFLLPAKEVLIPLPILS